MNAPYLKALYCECGYETADADDLFIHQAEMLLPDGDIDRAGIVHAEAAREDSSAPLTCMCGAPANDAAELDAHLLAAFTPADGIGADGARHAIFVEDFPVAEVFPRYHDEDLPQPGG